MVKRHNAFAVFALVAIAAVLTACSGTKYAYESATTLEAKAYVVTEHYAAVLKEANALNLQGSARAAVQAADSKAAPLVLKLREVAQAYTAAKTADNEDALQKALNAAAVAVSDLVNAVKGR